MKKLTLITCIACLCITAQAQWQKARIDSLLNYYDTQFGYNGVAFVALKGNILLDKGYGYRDIEKKIKHDKNSIFQMGSVTKQFTAEIILKLAAEGKLSVDDKLSKYIPDYPKGDSITIKNLLTHTSGIYNYTDDEKWLDSVEHVSHVALIKSFRDSTLRFAPGSKFEYSNSNYYLLGYIIEKITGKSYEMTVTETILKPTGMIHSGFDFTNMKSSYKSTGYYTLSDSSGPTIARIADSTTSWAAGALYSTTEDMYKWHKALQQYKFVSKKWQEEAYKPFKKRYAYGWFVDSVDGQRVIAHSGGIPGFVSYIMRVEEEDLCIILISNYMGMGISHNNMAVKIIDALYKKDFTMPVASKAVAMDLSTLSKYTGEYVLAPGFSITISTKSDGLYAQGTGQPDFQILPESETMFYTKAVDAKIEFVKDETGKIAKMILHQGGHDVPGLKK